MSNPTGEQTAKVFLSEEPVMKQDNGDRRKEGKDKEGTCAVCAAQTQRERQSMKHTVT